VTGRANRFSIFVSSSRWTLTHRSFVRIMLSRHSGTLIVASRHSYASLGHVGTAVRCRPPTDLFVSRKRKHHMVPRAVVLPRQVPARGGETTYSLPHYTGSRAPASTATSPGACAQRRAAHASSLHRQSPAPTTRQSTKRDTDSDKSKCGHRQRREELGPLLELRCIVHCVRGVLDRARVAYTTMELGFRF